MSCDGCKYEEVWGETDYCNNCDEYIHDKFVTEGDEDVTDEELAKFRGKNRHLLSPFTLLSMDKQ